MMQVHDVHVHERLERYRQEAALAALGTPGLWRRRLARLLRELAGRLEATPEPALRRA